MRLRSLRLQGFAQFDELDVTFRDDAPNLILGPNEAGKSTLMTALYAMFFGLENPDRFVPWYGEGAMRGAIEFEDDDGNLVTLEGDLRENEVTVCLPGYEPWVARTRSRGKTREAQAFGDLLQEWLGFRDGQIFTATTFVRQADVIRADMDDMAPEIRRLLTGTVETNYGLVLRDLQKGLDELRRRPGAHKDRLIEERQAELVQLRTDYEVAVSWQERFAAWQHDQDELAQRVVDRERELTELDVRLARARRLVEAEKENVELAARFRELGDQRDKIDRFRKEAAEARRKVQVLSPAAGYDAVSLSRLEMGVESAQKRVSGLEGRQAAAERNSSLLMWLAMVLGIGLGVALGALVTPILAVVVLVALGAALFFLHNRGSVGGSDSELEEARQELARAEKARSEALNRFGVSTVQEALGLSRRLDEVEREMRMAESALGAVGDPDAIEERWNETAQAYFLKQQEIKGILAEDGALHTLGSRQQRADYCASLEAQVSALRQELDALHAERSDVGETPFPGSRHGDPAVLAQQMAELETEIARLELHANALETAIDTLQGCVGEVQGDCLGPVVEHTSRILSVMTGGRYVGVNLDDDLRPTVDMPDRRGIPETSPSRGVRDQLYFALRVALARSLAGGRTLPLVLDDPFVNLDPERLRRAVAFLKGLVPHTQVILFSCDPGYAQWLEPILTLERRETNPPRSSEIPGVA